MKQPLVSIVTPSLNQGRFIEDTLASIDAQIYAPIEHLVVDGGSTDETLSVLRRFERPSRRWLSEPDDGQGDAITKGFRLSGGEIVTWLNADDVYVDGTVIERVVAAFTQHPSAGVVTGAGVYISDSGNVIRARPAPGDVASRTLRRRDVLLQPSTFFRREVVENIQIDPELHFAFDWDLFIRIADRYEIVVVDEPLGAHRDHKTNKTSSGGSSRTRELAEVTRRYNGRWSWRYWLLALEARADAAIDRGPASLRPVLRRALYAGLMATHVLSRGRVQV